MPILRPAALALVAALLAGCQTNDLAEPPVPLGDFVLGHNVAVTDKAQKGPISREASAAEWEAAMEKAVEDRFGRYAGQKIYNIGISVDGYALAPPGLPVVLKPKSVLIITANIWDDAAGRKLNEKGEQLTIFEGMSEETLVGSGLTRTKQQQMDVLAFNAAKAVETWLLKHPEWFDMAAPGPEAPVVSGAAAPPMAAPAEPANSGQAAPAE